MKFTLEQVLPTDVHQATLVGRAWVPGHNAGPSPVLVADDMAWDLSRAVPTVSELLNLQDPVKVALDAVKSGWAKPVGAIADLIANSHADRRDPAQPYLLTPCDVQALRACGVTFVSSMLERVIEEQARGDAGKAQAVRQAVVAVIGDNLASIKPGSPEAMKLKDVLIAQGVWSQYLEVGIGPDAEIFTKSQPMSAVGVGAEVGIHPESVWNNPEPEVVLAVNSRGVAVGAALGNDVNLRDFEGRSALLLGKAKDNNASCAIGPLIRLFDASYTIDDVRRCTVHLEVRGKDGFVMRGESSLARISRDPLDLVQQTLNANHQYPDGFMLFLGTMFAPTQDRDHPGGGFTHHLGDVVRISSARLGVLENTINTSDRITPWTFGIRQLFTNLAARGLLAV